MITFRSLGGPAHLLVLDDVHILLDVGYAHEAPGAPYSAALAAASPRVDLVLLSHGDDAHTGLLPHLRTHCGLRAPVYATQPVLSLARVAALEHAGARAREEADPPLLCSAAEIAAAFESVGVLRYSEPTHLQGSCTGLTITAYAAGHSLGGTLWKIRSPASGTVLYAVQLHHTRERTLDGTALLRPGGMHVFEPLARPDVMITDAARALITTPRRTDREAAFIAAIDAAFDARRSVLVPVALDSRLLELLVLLSQHWEFARLRNPLCLVARHGREFLALARSLVEWFGGAVGTGVLSSGGVGQSLDAAPTGAKRKRQAQDDLDASSPLRFRSLELFPSPAALLNTYSSRDSKLILATPIDMSHGASRTIFAEHGFGSGDGNVVVLSDLAAGDGVFDDAQTLWDRWSSGQPDGKDISGKPEVGRLVTLSGMVDMTIRSKQPLAGAELEAHLAAERERRIAEQNAERDRQILEAQARVDVESDSSSDDSESDSDSDAGAENRRNGDTDDENEVDMVIGDAAPPPNQSQSQTVVVSEPGGGGMRIKRGKSRREEMAMLDDLGLDGGMGKGTNFDIYLRQPHSSLRSSTFFGAVNVNIHIAPKDSTRNKMFPFYERRRKVDGYGEIIDVGLWMRRGKEIGQEGEGDDATMNTSGNANGVEGIEEENASPANEAEGAGKEEPDPPSKFVSSTVSIELRCDVMYVDMSGLNDGRAVKTILPQVGARKMILVDGSPKCMNALVESFAQIKGMATEVFAPTEGETTTIGQHTKSFAISLSDSLVASLNMSSFEDNEVGYVRGRIALHESSSIPILEPISASEIPLSSSSLEAPASPAVGLPQSTLIGDLKLTLLKSRLSNLGISAEFAGEGVLLCTDAKTTNNADMDKPGDVVSVKKQGADRVFIEAAGPSDVYFTVRREVYGLHAIVGA